MANFLHSFDNTMLHTQSRGIHTKILVLGPPQAGKTSVSNFLGETMESHSGYRPTKGVRIVEFESNELELSGQKIDADVEMWDCSGDEKFNRCWPAFLDGADGIVLVASPDKHDGDVLTSWAREFIDRGNIPLSRVLIVLLESHNMVTKDSTFSDFRLPSELSGAQCVAASLSKDDPTLRLEFNAFMCRVISELKGF